MDEVLHRVRQGSSRLGLFWGNLFFFSFWRKSLIDQNKWICSAGEQMQYLILKVGIFHLLCSTIRRLAEQGERRHGTSPNLR